jgi:hypothetical protein
VWQEIQRSRGRAGAAERQKRHRQREKDGRLVVPVELDAEAIETLIEAKVLDGRSDCYGREALAAAVANYLKISRYA